VKHNFETDTVLKGPLQKGFYLKARNNYGIMEEVITQVSGPDILRHLRDARNTVACSPTSIVRVVDWDRECLNGQIATWQMEGQRQRPPLWQSCTKIEGFGYAVEPGEFRPLCGDNSGVEFYCNNIADMEPTVFIDADLMATVGKCGDDLLRTLNKQRRAFPFLAVDNPKAFIFTVCVRNGGGLDANVDWVVNKLVPLTGGAITVVNKERMTNEPCTRKSRRGWRGVTAQKYDCEVVSNPNVLSDVSMYFYHDDGAPMLTGMLIYN